MVTVLGHGRPQTGDTPYYLVACLLLGFEGLTDLEDLILRHPQQPVAELVHRQLRDNGVKVLKGGGSPLWQALPMHFDKTSKK